MQRLPTVQCREAWQIVQIRAEIIDLAACFADSTEVQDIANEAIPCRLILEVLLDIYFREVNAALCFLQGTDSGDCDRPWSCGALQINTTETVNWDLIIWDPFASGFNFPYLVTEFGTIYFSINGADANPVMSFLLTVTFPVLNQADAIYCGGQPALVSFSAPLLTQITAGDLNVSGNGGLTSYDFTSLISVVGNLVLDGQLNTTALFPNLTTVGGNIALGGVDVAEVDISALTTFDGTFACANARLDAAQVNAILIKLDDIGLSNQIVFLVGANMAVPTGAGITAMNNLIGRGCTVGVGP